MFNKYIALQKKSLSTPESDAMVAKLRKINNHIREAHAVMLQEWINGILLSDPDNLTNIYSHIHAILLAFIKKRQHVNSDEYFYLMKCGNAILNTGYVNDPNKSQYGQYKYMMALYFLNYIKKLTTYDFRAKYVCNINDYIRSCYNNISVDTCQQSGSHIEMRHIYMNLKKIAYIKQYPYSIDSKIISIMLDYWQHNDYKINELPASYISKDRILSYDELTNLEVSQHEMDSLFGAYSENTKDIAIELIDEVDTIDSVIEEPSVIDSEQKNIQNDEIDVHDEQEEYAYPDDYD